MTARQKRLISDWEQVKKDFAGHQNIAVTPVGEEPYEKYQVTYFVNGIYLLPDGRIVALNRHEVEIILHAEYPRYKPVCRINTPIWHPNFRDGQICIGDIWGAGESLSDIIINIGDMIQYKSWNSYSPLCADAADWAIKNKHLFPVGNVELHKADYTATVREVEIDLFSEDGQLVSDQPISNEAGGVLPTDPVERPHQSNENDFDITPEELAGISYVPTAQRMQSAAQGGMVKGNRINFKTILVKGIIWALIGAFLGFGISELTGLNSRTTTVLRWMGEPELADFYEKYDSLDENATEADFLELYDLQDKIRISNEEAVQMYGQAVRVSTAIWSAMIALFVGLFLGIGEGVYYGSKEKAVIYGLIGAGISLVIGFISGYLAQWMYSVILPEDAGAFQSALIRGLGWAVMGLGIGLAVGLIKPAGRRILFCSLGGLAGAFLGGFLFEYIVELVSFGANDTGTIARGISLIIMGLLIGLGVGLLEQFAKAAWLKVVRGEFEGKEYLVFAGTTSIGNNGKNTIVLFKDKLVGPHHCDIVLEGSKYVLVDQGTPMGTVVNGQRVMRHILRRGDAIAVGNSVLVFQTK